MRKIIMILALMFACCACAESLPSQSGLDAAQAVVGMHNAVITDVFGGEACYSEPVGGDGLFVLYADAESKNFLMVSLGETGDRADIAVLQSYTLADFDKSALLSLTALAMPFIPEENWVTFEQWRDDTAAAVAEKAAGRADFELTYYTGEYISCAMSLYHDAAGPMFTALVSWNEPLSAADITTRMEGMADGQADDK